MGQDLSMLVGPLREPKPLEEALQRYHERTRSCIGLSFPIAAECPQMVLISDESYKLALRDLDWLLILGIKGYGSGLIRKLKSFAHDLSCPMHQRDPDHTLQFAYYWVALEHLPNSFTQMGFFLELPLELSLDVARDAASDERCYSYNEWLVRTRAVVEGLDAEKMVIVHRAVQQLERGWLKKWEDVNRISLFRKMLERRLDIMSEDEDGRIEIRETEKQWSAWHWGLPNEFLAEGSSETTEVNDDDNSSKTDDDDNDDDDNSSDTDDDYNDDDGGDESTTERAGESHDEVEVVETHDIDNATIAMGERSPRPGPTPLRPKSPLGSLSTLEPLLSNLKSTRSASKVTQQPSAREDCDINQGRSSSAPQILRFRNNKPTNKISPRSRAKPCSLAYSDDASALPNHQDDPCEENEPRRPRERPYVLDEHVTGYQSNTQGELVSSTGHNTAVEPTSLPYSFPEHSDRSPIHDPDAHDTNLEMNTELPNDHAPNPAYPDFQPIKSNQKSIRAVTDHVFKEMKRSLVDKKDLNEGYVYTLRLVDRPGFVKIGHTKNTIEDRAKQIQRCFTYELEPINDDDRCGIKYRAKVEKLVHTELKKYRRTFLCDCPPKTRGGKQHCHVGDDLTTHSEWFEIEEAKACEVVERWRKWMRTDPYCNGILRPTEQARLERFADNPELMKAMTVQVKKDKIIQREGEDVRIEVLEDTDTWRWKEFLAFPKWKLYLLLRYNDFFGARIWRSTHSRWDSLWKYWQSNVLLLATFFLVPFMLFTISDLLPFVSASNLELVLANSAILGVGAVLFAA